MHTIVIQKSQASDKYIFILAFYLSLAILRFLRNFLYKKSRAYPTVFSSEPVTKLPEVPPYAYHCYTKAPGFR